MDNIDDALKNRALATLKKYYGYDSFRRGQWEVISAAMGGRDSLVLMPTGGGKSLCYQLPALLSEGYVLVVSPLIALMNDQTMGLVANGIAAGCLHSNRDERLNLDTLEKAWRGECKILYVSPERLMLEIARWPTTARPSLIAIDEAHCISQWGHDFRPVYTELKALKEKFPATPVMALTATADHVTRDDISRQLGLENPYCHVGSFDRPNLSLTVLPDPGRKKRLRIISDLVFRYRSDAGIVYCLSRKLTEQMNEALQAMGIGSVAYHAGMDAARREAAQRAFVNGDVQVVCATVAFGMGIDKSNIRWVVHNNLPGNIESYYQEIGRAGRDGLPAETILFYSYSDVLTRTSFAETSGRVEINMEKLHLMERYAESKICRRRILLSYFSEEKTCDCGNCDVCRHPPMRFDGTVLAQKAMSAIIRTGQQVGMYMLIDILRASGRKDLFEKGYNQLKTYGAGRDLSQPEWLHYITQMLQLGLIEVAYDDSMHFRVTPYGKKALYGQERVLFSRFEQWGSTASAARKRPAEQRRELSPDEALLEGLKKVRKKVADKEGIAPYMVFADTTLVDMVRKHPLTLEEFRSVSGVGVVKASRYFEPFAKEIAHHLPNKKAETQGITAQKSLMLHNAGFSIEDIADERGIQPQTVAGHLAPYIIDGTISDWESLVSRHEVMEVRKILSEEDLDKRSLLMNSVDRVAITLGRAVLILLNQHPKGEDSGKCS